MEITAAAALVLEDRIDEGRTDVAEREQRDESGRQEPGPFPPRMLSDSARVCVCVPSSRGTERELMEAIVRVQRM